MGNDNASAKAQEALDEANRAVAENPTPENRKAVEEAQKALDSIGSKGD